MVVLVLLDRAQLGHAAQALFLLEDQKHRLQLGLPPQHLLLLAPLPRHLPLARLTVVAAHRQQHLARTVELVGSWQRLTLRLLAECVAGGGGGCGCGCGGLVETPPQQEVATAELGLALPELAEELLSGQHPLPLHLVVVRRVDLLAHRLAALVRGRREVERGHPTVDGAGAELGRRRGREDGGDVVAELLELLECRADVVLGHSGLVLLQEDPADVELRGGEHQAVVDVVGADARVARQVGVLTQRSPHFEALLQQQGGLLQQGVSLRVLLVMGRGGVCDGVDDNQRDAAVRLLATRGGRQQPQQGRTQLCSRVGEVRCRPCDLVGTKTLPEQRDGVSESLLGLVEQPQPVHGLGDLEVVLGQHLLLQRQGLLEEALGLAVVALGHHDRREVVVSKPHLRVVAAQLATLDLQRTLQQLSGGF
mmetsp:Transcript_47038/g.117298  ORF Transcript_47038/g.117298 Transcript_47038/m.117298 type:complete len:423 (-) Transcript_47038:1543-2811(-)